MTEQMSHMRGTFFKRYRTPLLLFLVVFLAGALFSIFMKYPTIADEYNIFAEGVSMVGGSPLRSALASSAYTAYYGYGYAVLFGWVYALVPNPEFVYHIALLVNVALLGGVSVLAYRIARQFFELEEKPAVMCAVITALCMGYLFFAVTIFNEMMLAFLAWLAVYLLLAFRRAARRQWVYALLLGAVCMYAYAVHGRGLAILFAVGLALLIVVIRARRWKSGLCSLAAFAVAALIIYWLDTNVKAMVYHDLFGLTQDQLMNTADSSIAKSIPVLLEPQNWPNIAKGLAGQVFYFVTTTFGMAVVALLIWVKLMRKPKAQEQSNMRLFGTTVLLMGVFTLLIAVAFFANIYSSKMSARADYYIYGRYLCMMTGFVFFFVCAYFWKHRTLGTKRFWLIAAVLFAVCMAAGVFVMNQKILGAQMASTNSYVQTAGILPLMGIRVQEEVTTGHIIAVCAVATAVFTLLCLLMQKKKIQAACLLLLGISLYSMVYVAATVAVPASQRMYDLAQPLRQIQRELNEADVPVSMYYVTPCKPDTMVAQMALVQPMEYLNLDTDGYGMFANLQENSIIWSIDDQKFDTWMDEIYYVSMQNAPESGGLWVYGDALKNSLEALGYDCVKRTQHTVDLGAAAVWDADRLTTGPLGRLEEGQYRVSLLGTGLDTLTDFAYEGKAVTGVLSEQTAGRVTLDLTLEQADSNVCITARDTRAPSQAMWTQAEITVLFEPVSVTQSASIVPVERKYSLNNLHSKFIKNVEISDGVTMSRPGYILEPGASIIMKQLIFAPGAYRLTLDGLHMEQSAIELLPAGMFEVLDVQTNVEENSARSRVIILAAIQEARDDVQLVLKNNGTEKLEIMTLNIQSLEGDAGMVALGK